MNNVPKVKSRVLIKLLLVVGTAAGVEVAVALGVASLSILFKESLFSLL